ncbi:MAG: MXAN_5187 C-terminal domain-containing protein, partial [Myxococcota bacterium]
IADKALISLVEDDILNVIISSELFSKVKENNISCDIFTHKNRIYIVSLAPVFMEGGIAGSVIVVKMMDDSLAYSIRDITSFDISIFSKDNLIGSTFRQQAPEVLVSIMQSKERILLHGRLKGEDSPYFPTNIPAMITIFQDFVPGRDIKVAITASLAGKFSDMRDIQFIVLVVLVGVLIIGIIVSFSISRTIYSTINLINDSLAPAIKGNLSVQIPEVKVPSPFDELVRSINKLLFVAGEKVSSPSKSVPVFTDIQKDDIRRTFTGEIKVSQKPASREIKTETASLDVNKDLDFQQRVVMANESQKGVVPKPMSGEIFVGGEITSEDVGEMIENEREEGYNPDATMVASLEEIEALDKAKQSAQAKELDEFRRLFDRYVAMRLQNGESIENLNFDNFIEKIKVTKAELMKKGNYLDVKFDVIIKNGKTTLKANPVK